MKINENYVMQNVSDEYLVIPIAEEADRLRGVIRLNESGAFLWDKLANGGASEDDLKESLMQEYQVDAVTAENDIRTFLNSLDSIGCLE